MTPERVIKTLLVAGSDGGLVALLLRGDHELNPIKAEKHPLVAAPLRFAEPTEVREATAVGVGSLGPVGLELPIIADRAVMNLGDFICGANRDGYHLIGVNWERDLPLPEQVADLRNVVAGDPSPRDEGRLQIARGIEVGHIFQLGTKYSESMGATVLDEAGKARTLVMGCYGIGVTRIVAAAIEQNHDDHGILWPEAIAPFTLALLPMNMHKSERLRQAVETLYQQLLERGVDLLLDDRKERPGIMFADMELIGIPHRLVLGDRGLDKGTIEYRGRNETESTEIPLDELFEFLQQKGI